MRQVRVREPRLYMERAVAGDAVASTETVARKDLPFEYMLNALRLREGFSLRDFSERTGLPLSAIEAPLQTAEDKGWLLRDGIQVSPTERGFDFLSDVQSLFLPD
jgi:oxygen-independent coproporphyrinogen-3 oxidase